MTRRCPHWVKGLIERLYRPRSPRCDGGFAGVLVDCASQVDVALQELVTVTG
jgi:hypothetical protein